MPTSDRVKQLYSNMYSAGIERAWRDVGAKDKADDIVRIWRRAKLSPWPNVVEIGCGEGAVAQALQQRDFFKTYTGFELSDSGVAQCIERNIPRAEFVLIDSDRMPLEDDSADVVVLTHVVEHLEHPRQLIYDARRIAPYVIVEVPLELNIRLPRNYVWDDLGHINKYTSTSIRQLVQTCDLEVVEQFTTNPGKAVSLFHRASHRRVAEWHLKEGALKLAPGIARGLFTYHETILARRPT